MKPPKFVYRGTKMGLPESGELDRTDGYLYRYGIDAKGNYWIARVEYKSGMRDWESPPDWKPNGTDGMRVPIITPAELTGEFDAHDFLKHRTHNSASEYVTRHTGGSIRHAGIRVMDVMEMIHDYSKDAVRAIEDAYALGVLHATKKPKENKVSKLSRATKRR